jgi:hypothetical protein
MKDIHDFLKLNGFNKTHTILIDSTIYSNGKCTVAISPSNYIVGVNGHLLYSDDLNIYWLIGVLTYSGFIDKEYKQ